MIGVGMRGEGVGGGGVEGIKARILILKRREDKDRRQGLTARKEIGGKGKERTKAGATILPPLQVDNIDLMQSASKGSLCLPSRCIL